MKMVNRIQDSDIIIEETYKTELDGLSFFTKLRRFFGIKTREERREEEREIKSNEFKELTNRLTECLTMIDTDLEKEAKEDYLKRKASSRIRPRNSFSEEELRQIDERSINKKIDIKESDINFIDITSKTIDIVKEQSSLIARKAFDFIMSSLDEDRDSVIKNLAANWHNIDRDESDCWIYLSNDILSYDKSKSPIDIALGMNIDRDVENIVNIRNSIIAAVDLSLKLEFERLIKEEIFKKRDEDVSKVDNSNSIVD